VFGKMGYFGSFFVASKVNEAIATNDPFLTFDLPQTQWQLQTHERSYLSPKDYTK